MCLCATAHREFCRIAYASQPRRLHERSDDRDVVGPREQRQHLLRNWIVVSAGRQRGNLAEVVSAARDHMPNAAPRVIRVALEPRGDVHVKVHDGLAGRLARVEPHVVAVGMKLLVQLPLHHLD